MNSYDNRATDHLDDGISTPTPKPSGPPVVAHQVSKEFEGRYYPSSVLDWRGHRYDFAHPNTARAALGDLLKFQCALGEYDGLLLWERRYMEGDETVADPNGWPELRWASGSRTTKRLMSARGHGAWCSPLDAQGWKVTDVEPNGGPVYVRGTLKECILWAAAQGRLDLYGEAFVAEGFNVEMLRALAPHRAPRA